MSLALTDIHFLIDDKLMSVVDLVFRYKECLKHIKELEDKVEKLEYENKEIEEQQEQPKKKRGRPKKFTVTVNIPRPE